jgi:hypothetical protein
MLARLQELKKIWPRRTHLKGIASLKAAWDSLAKKGLASGNARRPRWPLPFLLARADSLPDDRGQLSHG